MNDCSSLHTAARLALAGGLCLATTAQAELSAEELAKLAQNPVGNLISVPFQNNTNFNTGPLSGTQNILNIQPVIPIEVSCRIAGAESIALLAEKNPFPLMANAVLANGTEGHLNTRFKMGQTSVVKVVVKAGGKHYIASREIKVTIGGCGG